MSKMHTTFEPAAAQANTKGCGCGGHGKQEHVDKLPASGQEQTGPSAHNKHVQIKQPTDHSGCCCGDKTSG